MTYRSHTGLTQASNRTFSIHGLQVSYVVCCSFGAPSTGEPLGTASVFTFVSLAGICVGLRGQSVNKRHLNERSL